MNGEGIKPKKGNERIREAAQAIQERNEEVSQSGIARELKISRERVRQLLERYPGLETEIGLVNAATFRVRAYADAVAKLRQEGQLLTAANIAHEMEITPHELRQYANKLAYTNAGEDLPLPMSSQEFEYFRIRVFSKTLRGLDLPVTFENLSDLLGKDVKAVREFFRRHPDLREEVNIEIQKPRPGTRRQK